MITGATDTTTRCTECGKDIDKEVLAAYRLLYGAYHIRTTTIAERLEKLLRRRHEYRSDRLLGEALADELEADADAIVAAVLHRMGEA